ncbi:sulfite oxidase-like oxidoreductase [soil metagenome]
MSENFILRGFRGRPRAPDGGRLPPGQYIETGFPVLSAGPTPHIALEDWSFTIRAGGTQQATTAEARWRWDEFIALPRDMVTKDIHCVTKWSKFDTKWEGISLDTLLDAAELMGVSRAAHLVAVCEGGYTTNLALADVTGGKAWIAFGYDGAPLDAEHGGPARLLVPHLYFWKSAKWVRELVLHDVDEPGFGEQNGYHNRGDPWKEERYSGD